MDSRFDWKFLLMLVVAIAGAAIPVGLWQVDLSSKALSLTVKSTAELQPKGLDTLDGIQMSVDGKPLESPYVSVLEISNSGSKPILTSEFEGPIRVSTAGASKLVKVRSTASKPTSLEPTVALAEGVVLIQPLLLNPGDTIRITAIAAFARPVFNAQARVAGIPEISINDAQSGRETKRYWLGRIASVLLMTLYIINLTEAAFLGLRRRASFLRPLATGIISGFAGAILVAAISPENHATVANVLPIVGVAAFLSLPFTMRRMRRTVA